MKKIEKKEVDKQIKALKKLINSYKIYANLNLNKKKQFLNSIENEIRKLEIIKKGDIINE